MGRERGVIKQTPEKGNEKARKCGLVRKGEKTTCEASKSRGIWLGKGKTQSEGQTAQGELRGAGERYRKKAK